MISRQGVVSGLVLVLGLALALAANAQIPVGPEFRADSDTGLPTHNGTMRQATMGPDGRFVVTWINGWRTAPNENVVGRRFDASGRAIGVEFVVNSYTTGIQNYDTIASDDAGNFVIVWESVGQDGSYHGVFGQRFGASGVRLGAEFQVNETTAGSQWRPSVAMSPDGAFVVAWTSAGVVARRYDASGLPVGGEFRIHSSTFGPSEPSIALDGAGNFVVVWLTEYNLSEVRGRLFTATGVPQGAEFVVNPAVSRPMGFTTRVARNREGAFVVIWHSIWDGIYARRYAATGVPLGNAFRVTPETIPEIDIAIDEDGDFVIAWTSGQDRSGTGVFARRFDSAGTAGPEFRVNTYTTGNQFQPTVASDRAGNFVVRWFSGIGNGQIIAQRYLGGLMATALSVDAAAGPMSDGNRVIEAGEIVAVAPSWLNANFGAQTFTGAASSFAGPGAPGDPTYSIPDAAASYGTVATGTTATCVATSDCYALGISVPNARPSRHWDAAFREEISPAGLGAAKNWTVHVGDSFSDVPRSNPFYRFVETLLHNNVTGGCSATGYCPATPTSREQMAVFVLVAKEGSGYVPPACTAPVFNDVPATSPFCRWIEELARRGVVSGCGGGNYCPASGVSRQEMAIFVLATQEPGPGPAACGTTPMFTDVPASSPFCRWIEELARRGVVTGCGAGRYCPTSAVTREQMGVFLTVTFGLQLYGP